MALIFKDQGAKMQRSYYSNFISNFCVEDDNNILGHLTRNSTFDITSLQTIAWREQIRILKEKLPSLEQGKIYFEYSIPRMGKRVDNILIIRDFIFVIEFKVGDTEYKKNAIEQVVDYCLDLQNFH